MSKLKCPHCQEITTTFALDTNTKLDGSITRRRRCSNCQERFNTTERYADNSCDDIQKIRAKAAEDLDTNQNPKVRAIAAKLLGEIGTEANIVALCQGCSDPDDDVRLSAVDALGKIGSRCPGQTDRQTDHLLTYSKSIAVLIV